MNVLNGGGVGGGRSRKSPLWFGARTAIGDKRAENHARGNARSSRARLVGLLCRLQVQPRDENERRQMAGLCSFVRFPVRHKISPIGRIHGTAEDTGSFTDDTSSATSRSCPNLP